MTVVKTVEMPTIEVIDPEAGSWCVGLPDSLLPAGVVEIAMTDRGLYVELANKRFDFIPWPEVAELVDSEGADRVDVPIYQLTPMTLAGLLGPGVRVVQGPAPTVLTGRERAYCDWVATCRDIEYVARPERLVLNGRAV